jgi:transposase
MTRRYACSPIGQRAFSSAPINYGPNISVIGAIRQDGVAAGMSIEGPVDGEVFLAFTRHILAPALQPGDVLVMDNLSVHKVKGVVEAVEAVGARVLFLPPYSPDYNPIEQCWAKFKEWMRSQAARTKKALNDAITQGFLQIDASLTSACFQHCGYG